MTLEPLKGHYFTYCQWCRRDGRCHLRHYQFLGQKRGKGKDKTPYPGHENLRWHASAFQTGSERGSCTGKILKSESFYYPLMCECGTVISSLTFSALLNPHVCAKFQPNERGKEIRRQAEEIARQKGIDLLEVDPEGILEPDPDYLAAMEK